MTTESPATMTKPEAGALLPPATGYASKPETFGEQIVKAAKACRQSKRHLVAELLESNRIIKADAIRIHKLAAALSEIIELSESSPSSLRDFGDIAREALKP